MGNILEKDQSPLRLITAIEAAAAAVVALGVTREARAGKRSNA
jgi:hypothetical protein